MQTRYAVASSARARQTVTTKETYEKFPSGLQAVFVVVALFAAEYVVGALAVDLRSIFGLNPANFDVFVVLLGNGLLFAAMLQIKNLTYASLFHPSRNSIAATLRVLAVPILMVVPALFLVTSVAVSILTDLVPLSSSEEAMFDRMMSNDFASIVTACVLAPVLEEMLFRGIILRSFLNQYSRTRAILGSAVLFGFAHLNIYQFVVALAIGIFSGWLYERARSLWPCILLHAAYNTCSTLASMAVSDSPADGDYIFGSGKIWLLSLGLALVGGVMLKRILGRRPTGG
ncbi:MAG TPA: CPBP family intramembrane glutamic endopeptidase [Burkholderiales bacterium]|nr:CPBP family intramembrane glutamic endopeptidase [Burkholderiales bacterium]